MYLVTGGSGFCGVEIVRHLIAKGQRVRVLDIEPPPGDMIVEFARADVRDAAAVSQACRGVDKVIHTAAKVPISKAGRQFWEVNVEGTRHVLQAALENKVSKVVHLSSSAVQMSEVNPVDEDAPYHPVGLYAKTKMEAEKVCREYAAKGLTVDMLRPRTVVGLGRLGIFDILFDWISEGRNIYILGSGKNKIQFLHSEDLAACCYLSSVTPGSHVFNVGSKEYGPLREDLGALIAHAGTGSRIVSLPVGPCLLTLAALDALRLSPLASWHYRTYHRDFYFTNRRAREVLGWSPRYGNREILKTAYTSYVEARGHAGAGYGTSHRKALKQGVLKFLKSIS